MSSLVLYGMAGLGGLALLMVTARRPAIGAALLVVAVPLTAGLGGGGTVRPDQGAVVVVALGWLMHELPRRRPIPFIGLDLAVTAFALGGVVIPWAVLMLTHATLDLTTLKTVLQPAQYLIVYLIFSRTEQTSQSLRLTLNLAMAACVVVSAVAAAELFLPSVQGSVESYFDHPIAHAWDTGIRPSSTLGHYSGVAGFGLMNATVALSLAVTGNRDFPLWWLGLVMLAGVGGILATTTLAPLLVLPVAVLVVFWYSGWRPTTRQVVIALAVLGAAFVAFLPFLQGRINNQLSGRGSLVLPETIATRILLWQEFFVPAYLQHGLWFGTGTLLPPEIPRPLSDNIDNEFLFAAYRAGVIGLALLAALLAGIVITGLRLRRASPLARGVGAAAVSSAVTIAIVGLTSEYITFAGVSQELWMIVGLVTLLVTRPVADPVPAPVQRRTAAPTRLVRLASR